MFKERCTHLTCLEEILKRDVYLICHNSNSMEAQIDETMSDVLRRVIRFSKKRRKAAIIIQTPGGSLDGTIYICNFFREYYDGIDTYIGGDCYSGGTIIALASDKIYMNRNACLGPIDIQIRRNKVNPWNMDLYGKVNAFEKALNEKKITPEMLKSFKGDEDVLAEYHKLKYTFRGLIGDYVKKHCIEGKSWEDIWSYMAEINISHGSPLTYKKCKDLGLDVKRMPAKIDAIVSKILRDVEDEFGGLMSNHLLNDFYNTYDSAEIKRHSSKEKNDDAHEVMISKNIEKLAIIETSQSAYIQEIERAVTVQDFIPACVVPVRVGWREEYDTSSVAPEVIDYFEDYMDNATRHAFFSQGFEPASIPYDSYVKTRNIIVESYFEETMKILKDVGVDLDSMSSVDKGRAAVEYLVMEQFEEEKKWAEKLAPIWQQAAKEAGINFSELSPDERERFIAEVMESKVYEVMEWLGIDEAEFMELTDKDVYEYVLEYSQPEAQK